VREETKSNWAKRLTIVYLVVFSNRWVEHGKNDMSFRLASWRNQHAAQADLKIATENDTSMMAFVSKKAISNRKAFATKLRDAMETANFQSVDFLKAIHTMVMNMHSPCLRLELLQYILSLDNRYSVAHVARSVELAATCLSIRATTEPNQLLLSQEEEKVEASGSS